MRADVSAEDWLRTKAEPNLTEIERALTAFARSGNGGLIVTPSPGATRHRDLILTLGPGGIGCHLCSLAEISQTGMFPGFVDPKVMSRRRYDAVIGDILLILAAVH